MRDAGVPCDEAVVPSVGVMYPVLGFKWRIGLSVSSLLFGSVVEICSSEIHFKTVGHGPCVVLPGTS